MGCGGQVNKWNIQLNNCSRIKIKNKQLYSGRRDCNCISERRDGNCCNCPYKFILYMIHEQELHIEIDWKSWRILLCTTFDVHLGLHFVEILWKAIEDNKQAFTFCLKIRLLYNIDLIALLLLYNNGLYDEKQLQVKKFVLIASCSFNFSFCWWWFSHDSWCPPDRIIFNKNRVSGETGCKTY